MNSPAHNQDAAQRKLICKSISHWCRQILGRQVRAGVQLTSDSSSHGELIAGTTVDLDGGEVLRLGRGTSEIIIVGLPQSEHTVRLAPPQPIPLAMRRHCAALSIGLTMPVKLEVSIELGND